MDSIRDFYSFGEGSNPSRNTILNIMWECKHCHKEFENYSPSQKANHSRWCAKNPKRKNYVSRLKETRESQTEEQRNRANESIKKLWERGVYDNIPHDGFKGKTHTPEIRKRISEGRKKWLKQNPEKHLWNISKNYSIPCEQLKQKLRNNNILFEEEFQPLFPERFFSIDIAFPEKKIGIEVNGNQHYNKDKKTLKKYYQERHDLIEESGWKLIELHYLDVYKDNIIEEINGLVV